MLYIMETVTESDTRKRYAMMRLVCFEALLRFGKANHLRVVRAHTDRDAHRHSIGSRIRNAFGMDMDVRAGHVITGTNGYISSRPHGDAFHTGYKPGYGSEQDWKRFFAHPLLSYVLLLPDSYPSGENFDPVNRTGAQWVLIALGLQD